MLKDDIVNHRQIACDLLAAEGLQIHYEPGYCYIELWTYEETPRLVDTLVRVVYGRNRSLRNVTLEDYVVAAMMVFDNLTFYRKLAGLE